jgi:hypothetical protein
MLVRRLLNSLDNWEAPGTNLSRIASSLGSEHELGECFEHYSSLGGRQGRRVTQTLRCRAELPCCPLVQGATSTQKNQG